AAGRRSPSRRTAERRAGEPVATPMSGDAAGGRASIHKIPLLPQPCRISHNETPGHRRPLARKRHRWAEGRQGRQARGGAMNQAIRQDAIYALGYTDEERQRLTEQAELFRSCTARLLQDAGLGPGAHVLDVGCGVGDVSILASSLVGPSGSVVGIDVDPRSLAFARQRVCERGLTNVTFTEATFVSSSPRGSSMQSWGDLFSCTRASPGRPWPIWQVSSVPAASSCSRNRTSTARTSPGRKQSIP